MTKSAALSRVRWYHPLIAILGSVLLSVVAAALFLFWQVLAHRPIVLAALLHDFSFNCTVAGAQEAGLLGLTLWGLSRAQRGELPASLGRPLPRVLLQGLGLAVAVMLGVMLFEWFCDTVLHTNLSADAGRLPLRPTSLGQLPLAFLVIAVLAPLAEESFFRALLPAWLMRHWGGSVALGAQAVFFGMMHLKWLTPGGLDGWLLTVELAAMGFVFGLASWRSGNLWVSVTAHALNNGIAVVLLFFLLPRG